MNSTKEEIRGALEEVRKEHSKLDALWSMIRAYRGLMWIKEWDPKVGKWRMIVFSQGYANMLLGDLPVSVYEGRLDAEFWDQVTADTFEINDHIALSEGFNDEVTEPFYSPHTKLSGVFKGEKWSFSENEKMYVCGRGKVELDV